MKKFIIFLFVIAAIGAAGFFAGWTGLTLPLGTVGVLRSKTHGVDTRLVREGEFRWVWYRLIPANAKIIPFTLKPVNGTVQTAGTLAQSDVYKRFVGQDARFSWKLECNYSFIIDENALPALVSEQNIQSNEELDQLIEQIELQIKNIAGNYDKAREIFENTASDSLADDINAAFPYIDKLKLSWDFIETPDFALYDAGKSMYDEYIARQKLLLNPGLTGAAERNLSNQFRFDELERYGELFSKYPLLLQYMELESR